LVDITPNARVLVMLGEVDIEPWQCIAELVDNSIDGYMRYPDYSKGKIQIEIHLPTKQELENGKGCIEIRDSGYGMSKQDVINSVKAGWSGNKGYDRLGLFGMGFNISTARLGNKTTIMSTRANDKSTYWIDVDPYAMLEHSENYPGQMFEAKDGEMAKHADHGTTIKISNLKKDIVEELVNMNPSNNNNLRKRLGRIYSPLMKAQEIDLRIFYESSPPNGHSVSKWEHCIWDKKHFTNYKEVDDPRSQQLSALHEINIPLKSQDYCKICWKWFDYDVTSEYNCPVCNSENSIHKRKRVITGWIGVQRAFFGTSNSKNYQDHYGIDLVRNGRVIEELSKDFFSVIEKEGNRRTDYPVEGNQGGRIVGVLDVSFVPCDFRKSKFTRGDINWKLVMKMVQGNGLRPDVTKKDKGSFISTPLTKMVRGWGSAKLGGNKQPGSLTLIEGVIDKDKNGKFNLDGNKLPKLKGEFSNHRSLVERFWGNKDPGLSKEEKWLEGIHFADDFDPYDYDEGDKKQYCLHGNIKSECEECKPKKPESCIHGEIKSTCPLCNPNICEHGKIPSDCFDCHPELNPDWELNIPLSREYDLDSELSFSIEVQVFADRTNNSIKNGIQMDKISRKKYRVIYQEDHPMFTNFKERPSDYVIMEIAKTFSNLNPKASFSKIYLMLKEKYHSSEKIDVESVRKRANQLIETVKSFFSDMKIPWKQRVSESVKSSLIRDLQKEHKGEGSMEDELKSGQFIFRLSDDLFFEEIVQNYIPNILDGELFSSQFKTMNPAGRDRVKNDYLVSLRIVSEVSTRNDLTYEELFLTDLYIKKLNKWLV
jgi:hypothetical protein